MNTPLQNGLGHIFGPGKTVETAGMFPVWLEQDGSSIMGGIIDLQYQYAVGAKVIDLYPTSIRTATPCYKKATGEYIPIPTFRVLNDVDAEETTVNIAAWEGCAKPIAGINICVSGDTSKNIKTSGSNLKAAGDGTFNLTITPNLFGVLKPGDALVLKEAAEWEVKGLTKSNLDYPGADPTSKLQIALVDRGRLLEKTAPSLPKNLKEKLQTVKYEED